MFIINIQDLLFAAWKNSQFSIDFMETFILNAIRSKQNCTTLFFDTTYVLTYYDFFVKMCLFGQFKSQ